MTPQPPVPVASRPVRDGRWVHLATRSYGTSIYRVDGRHPYYVKTTPPRDREDLRFHPGSEADRLVWLAGQGFPVPEVVEVGEDADAQWLVTTAVAGRPAAASWSPAKRAVVLDVVADLAAALHTLAVPDCPFDRTLAVSLPRARVAAHTGTIDLDDLDPRHSGWTARQLLAELDATPAPAEDDVVVCHGDLCLDNVLIAPDTLSLAGILDVGRLGTADRWLDLSVVLRNIGEECAEWGYHSRHTTIFLRRYGLAVFDDRRFEYYRLLDEFI